MAEQCIVCLNNVRLQISNRWEQLIKTITLTQNKDDPINDNNNTEWTICYKVISIQFGSILDWKFSSVLDRYRNIAIMMTRQLYYVLSIVI